MVRRRYRLGLNYRNNRPLIRNRSGLTVQWRSLEPVHNIHRVMGNPSTFVLIILQLLWLHSLGRGWCLIDNAALLLW